MHKKANLTYTKIKDQEIPHRIVYLNIKLESVVSSESEIKNGPNFWLHRKITLRSLSNTCEPKNTPPNKKIKI